MAGAQVRYLRCRGIFTSDSFSLSDYRVYDRGDLYKKISGSGSCKIIVIT